MGTSPLIHWSKQNNLFEPDDGGEMKQWQIIKVLNSDSGNIRVGMWPQDDEIYFSVEDLKPEDFVDSDTWEFPVRIEDLKQIIIKAQQIVATYQEIIK